MTHPKYKCFMESRHSLADGRTLSKNVFDRSPRVTNSSISAAAQQCRGFASLQEHATRLVSEGVMNCSHGEAVALLQEAASNGLLSSTEACETYLRSRLAQVQNQSFIDQIAIPTRDRPSVLGRLLDQLVDHITAHRPDVAVTVVDDSENPANRDRNEELIRQATRAGVNARYVGFAERAAYAQTLASASGVAPEITSYALLGDPRFEVATGSCRNTALLRTTGHQLICMDDDVECVTILPHSPMPAPVKIAPESGEVWFYENRDELDQLPGSRENLFRLLDETLNLHLSAAGDEPLDVLSTPPSLFRRISEVDSTVRVGVIGIAGDSGYDDPLSYYLQSLPTWNRFTASKEIYDQALTNRLVLRSPAQRMLSARSTCQSHCIALRNERLLPPFLPCLRGQDLVFGALLDSCIPGVLIGSTPRAIRHSPMQPRSYRPNAAIERVGQITTGEAIAFLIGSTQIRGTSVQERLCSLGQALEQLARMTSEEIQAHVFAAAEPMLYAWYQQVSQRHIDQHSKNGPAANDTLLLQSKLEGLLRTGKITVPIDLVEAFGIENGLSLFRESLGNLGKLLQAWPALWQAAQHISQDVLGTQ